MSKLCKFCLEPAVDTLKHNSAIYVCLYHKKQEDVKSVTEKDNSPKFSNHYLYPTYKSMISRCHNPRNKKYKYYGGNGIIVCDRWLRSFLFFLLDMGERPGDNYSIDRIDPYGNYEPGNCRWATKEQQDANRKGSWAHVTNQMTFEDMEKLDHGSN